MSDISELYREVILDHNKSPRNFRKLENANRRAEGYNPLCGDQITVYLKMEDGVIKEVTFQGSGCAISKASASMMTASVKGKTETEAEQMFDEVHKMLTGESNPKDGLEKLGKLAALSGVSNFPARVKCASLSWHTLRAALKGERGVASTE
ncbi:MAG: SUF system NifU family Fe-S cluster assembly protein [Deltaproteobacteria bacterium]|nr:SUF system NifU family Fe-S cluster assembly protein [Deltaproteobacteria bacterium]